VQRRPSPAIRSLPDGPAGRRDSICSHACVFQSSLGNACIDELVEKGNSEYAAPSNLVQPPLEDHCRRRWLAACKPERDRGTGRVGLTIKSREELLGLVEAAL